MRAHSSKTPPGSQSPTKHTQTSACFLSSSQLTRALRVGFAERWFSSAGFPGTLNPPTSWPCTAAARGGLPARWAGTGLVRKWASAPARLTRNTDRNKQHSVPMGDAGKCQPLPRLSTSHIEAFPFYQDSGKGKRATNQLPGSCFCPFWCLSRAVLSVRPTGQGGLCGQKKFVPKMGLSFWALESKSPQFHLSREKNAFGVGWAGGWAWGWVRQINPSPSRG